MGDAVRKHAETLRGLLGRILEEVKDLPPELREAIMKARGIASSSSRGAHVGHVHDGARGFNAPLELPARLLGDRDGLRLPRLAVMSEPRLIDATPRWRRRRMTRASPSTKSRRPRSVKARGRRLAEILAECSKGILPGDYSEAGISAFAAECAKYPFQPKAMRKPRQPRAPSISKLIEQAKQAGGSVTLPDGTKLDFGKPELAESDNPWLADLRKETKQ